MFALFRQATDKQFVPKPTSKSLPRGIRFVDVPGRRRGLGLQWRVDGRRKTKCFLTAEERDVFAGSLIRDIRALGDDALRLDESEARAWREFSASLDGASLDEVLACWRRHGKRQKPLTVAAAIAAYSEAKKAEGVSFASLSHYRPIFARFSAPYGLRDVSSVEREEVAAWISDLQMADYSRRSHHKRIASFFSWLRKNRMLAENPCEGLRPVKITPDEVAILTLEQASALFTANQSQRRELCGRLALEAFAGLRFSSAAQVVAEDIIDGGIVLPAAKIKTRRRQFIDGLPANLTAWLQWSKPADWSMTPRDYLREKSISFVRARVPHPHNALRHSFASYHVAAGKDAGSTAAILCHTSPKMLYAHYKGRATAADGAAYFNIMPTAS